MPELLAGLQAGEEPAAREVVRRFGPTVRSQVRVWLRMQDPRLRRLFDSLDVCQSAFASFFIGAAGGRYDLDDAGRLAALLMQIARHKLLRQVRRHRADRRDVTRLSNADPAIVGRDARPGPSTYWAGQELLVEFRRRLSDDERQLADLRAAGQSWSAIAAAMGGSPGSRRMQLARALDRVADELGLERPATGAGGAP